MIDISKLRCGLFPISFVVSFLGKQANQRHAQATGILSRCVFAAQAMNPFRIVLANFALCFLVCASRALAAPRPHEQESAPQKRSARSSGISASFGEKERWPKRSNSTGGPSLFRRGMRRRNLGSPMRIGALHNYEKRGHSDTARHQHPKASRF